ncbi:peptide methionine sulfoxide reductase MsrA [Phlyctochytrium arcticum]|nr:peptide methionine sulfoxide reductase MsrA [Phlyctochytrium arcticum]
MQRFLNLLSKPSTTPPSLRRPFSTNPNMDLATFGAGCFWGVEKAFQKKFPNLPTSVGYAGGTTESPSYKQVCTGTTHHAEVIQVQFDPSQVAYTDLLDFFFRMHDPTTLNRQGNDAGTQYRSAIFTSSPSQEKTAKETIASLQHHFGTHKIVTTVEPLGKYWTAEEYHQDYLNKNPHGYECPTHFERTWEKIHALYGGQ